MNSILDDQQLLVWNEGWGIDIFMNPLFKDFNFSGVGFSFAHYLYDFKHMHGGVGMVCPNERYLDEYEAYGFGWGIGLFI